MPYVRTVKTKSGATAVQVVWSSQRGSRKIEHLGSAHDDAGLETLKAAARQRIAAGQAELGLELEPTAPRRAPRPGWAACSTRLSAPTRCSDSRMRSTG